MMGNKGAQMLKMRGKKTPKSREIHSMQGGGKKKMGEKLKVRVRGVNYNVPTSWQAKVLCWI